MVKSKLDCFEFGKQLVETKDLDPTYVILYEWENSESVKILSYLISYWCFYHLGTAAWVYEQREYHGASYWDSMLTVVKDATHPRGTERRHYRGSQGLNSIKWLKSKGVNQLFSELFDLNMIFGKDRKKKDPTLVDDPITAVKVMEHVRTWLGFGDWIAFKIADMLERLNILPVVFNNDDVFNMFDSPRKGAELLADACDADTDDVYTWAVEILKQHLGHLKAPPRYERVLNIQEYETILCKWKSYMNGHYYIGKDIIEVKEGLLKYARCRTAQSLLKAGRGRLW